MKVLSIGASRSTALGSEKVLRASRFLEDAEWAECALRGRSLVAETAVSFRGATDEAVSIFFINQCLNSN